VPFVTKTLNPFAFLLALIHAILIFFSLLRSSTPPVLAAAAAALGNLGYHHDLNRCSIVDAGGETVFVFLFLFGFGFVSFFHGFFLAQLTVLSAGIEALVSSCSSPFADVHCAAGSRHAPLVAQCLLPVPCPLKPFSFFVSLLLIPFSFCTLFLLINRPSLPLFFQLRPSAT
jgi:hypothetical protein